MNETNRHIYESSTDMNLVREISEGNRDAMEVLMDRYLPSVSRIAYRILCDIPESESVTGAVFIKVWRNAYRYDYSRSVSVWIYAMVYSLCRLRLRRRCFPGLFAIRPSVYETSAPQPLSPEDDFITKETWEIYCRAAKYLSPRQRAAFVFRDLEGLSVEDVSEILKMSHGHIRKYILEAREKVKMELRKYGKVI